MGSITAPFKRPNAMLRDFSQLFPCDNEFVHNSGGPFSTP